MKLSRAALILIACVACQSQALREAIPQDWHSLGEVLAQLPGNPGDSRGNESASGAGENPPGQPQPADDLARLSDEFASAASLSRWQRVFRAEGSGADQLKEFRVQQGWLAMVPHASSWYQDYRGVLAFQSVKGDFIVSTRLRVTGRSGRGAPQSQFSLAGIMVRTPRRVNASTWRPGQENYVFLSLGAANRPGSYQYEVKTTRQSDSQLEIGAAPGPESEIRIARLGGALIALRRVGGGRWQVHRRYWRPDLPATLQVGLTTYTDWKTVEGMTPRAHNRTVIRGGRPDLLARFDYVRFRRPLVPDHMVGRRFADPNSVSDRELLALLGP